MALKYMDKSAGGKGGIVVNMSSIAGLGSETYVSAIHNATQSAVIELSRAFGSDNFYQTTGVRVMVICPGYTESEIIPHDQQQLLAMLYKDEWVDDFYNLIQRLSPQQKAENVGKGVLHMIREGTPGSIWISINNKPAYQIEIPQYEKLRV
ncbi:Alcohol dehydrogenase-related 31 kDa protein [Zootermopsis nevadensis]|uniref:15-hydroxyprostaglandin dehydrogenase [NAD(+)] n=1 Tax=Zootermopsis nevadensis TaxID=136037 RepID=A0A067QUR3_ZOONE|nr:Alcohol dehydrogenase-related 31 kDa protein [Zootermopsis nevadensis]